MQRAASHLSALLASSAEDLEPDWADAVASDSSEVEEILFEANSRRAAVRNRSRKRPWS